MTIYGRARVIDDLDEVFAFGDNVYERYWGPIDNDLGPRGRARDGPQASRHRRRARQDRVVGPLKLGGAY